MSTFVLFIALVIPGFKPVITEIPMGSAMECLGEVNYITIRAAELHKPGRIQASCIVITDEKQVAH